MDTTTNPTSGLTLLRLLQLASPVLPVGAFAYSQGMEKAVSAGWLRCSEAVEKWIAGLLQHSLARMEVPFFKRFYEAWQRQDFKSLEVLSRWYLAGRGTAELLAEERNMGRALQRLLIHLGILPAGNTGDSTPCFVSLFAGAACSWGVPLGDGCTAMLWAWTENQVTAAVRLVPLGQTQGQEILMHSAEIITRAVTLGLSLPDEEIGASAPGQVLASALHETQHTRLFRS